MANSNKNIVITPNTGSSTADPKIVFSGADASTAAQNITMTVYPTNGGTLSIDGTSGQLFSVSNNTANGSLFSVNDVSGIPSFEVMDTGIVKIAQYYGDVAIGNMNTISKYGHGGSAKILQMFNGDTAQHSQTHLIMSSGITSVTSSFIGSLSWVLPNVSTGPQGRIAHIGGLTDSTHTVSNPSGAISIATKNTTDITAIERMRIDSQGYIIFGKTSPDTATAGIAIEPAASIGYGRLNITKGTASGAGATSAVNLYYSTTSVGSIQCTSTATTFNTSSDVRLKKNIVDAPSAIEKVKAIQVRSFDWKDSDGHVEHGFIAQELNTVEPLAVVQGDTWGVDTSKLVGTLTKALQEALTEIESLKARVANLEA